MKRKFIGFYFLPLLCILAACSKHHPPVTGCDTKVIISQEQFKQAPNDHFKLEDVWLKGDCLTVRFSASGCSGNKWEVKLIDADMVMKSRPAQRSLRLSLSNPELCEAWITKEYSFNIRDLRLKEDNTVILHLGDREVRYEY